MDSQIDERDEFRGIESEVISVNCQNHSINLNYSAQKCSDFVKVGICQNATRKKHWFYSFEQQCQQVIELPPNGFHSVQVNDIPEAADTVYAVVVGGRSSNNSECPPLNKPDYFDFSYCQVNSATSTLTSNVNYSKIVSSQSNLTSALIVLSSILAIALLLIVLLICWIRKKLLPLETTTDFKTFHKAVNLIHDVQNQETIELMAMSMPVVYIVFANESLLHQKVVVAFASFLQEDLGFRVIFELWETRKASENYSLWMQKSMETADKIIIVWSNGASERVQRYRENICDFPDTFSPVVQHMQSSLFKYKNVSKYCLVYFSYSDKDSIPSDIFDKKEFQHFELMREFEKLYFNLINIEKYQSGMIHQFPKAEIQTLFDPEVTRIGPILKKVIEDATNQSLPLQLHPDDNGQTH